MREAHPVVAMQRVSVDIFTDKNIPHMSSLTCSPLHVYSYSRMCIICGVQCQKLYAKTLESTHPLLPKPSERSVIIPGASALEVKHKQCSHCSHFVTSQGFWWVIYVLPHALMYDRPVARCVIKRTCIVAQIMSVIFLSKFAVFSRF